MIRFLLSKTGTQVAGVVLSLTFVVIGLWLARYLRRRGW
jgi:hypothetical protein